MGAGASTVRVSRQAWESSTAAAYFLLPRAVRNAAVVGAAHSGRRVVRASMVRVNPFVLAFGSGYRALFSGLVPIPARRGEPPAGTAPSERGGSPSGIAKLAQSAVRPLERPLAALPPVARVSIAYLLAGLLVGALILLTVSALPVRLLGGSVVLRRFAEARSYVAVFAVALIGAVVVAYVLGAAVP